MLFHVKKTVLTVIALTTFSLLLLGQNKVPYVSIAPFTFNKQSPNLNATKADEISRMVAQYLSESGLVETVNREQWEAVMKEQELQTRENFIDGYIVEQGAAVGVDIIIFGHVIEVGDSPGYPTVHLVATEVATTKNVASEVLSPSGREKVGYEYIDDVLTSTQENSTTTKILKGLIKTFSKKSLQKNVMEFAQEYFPIRLAITKYKKEKKEKVYEVLLYGAKKYKFQEGQRMKVKQDEVLQNPDGTTGILTSEIASLKVDKIEGDYALCKVTKGKEELYSKKNEDIYVTF